MLNMTEVAQVLGAALPVLQAINAKAGPFTKKDQLEWEEYVSKLMFDLNPKYKQARISFLTQQHYGRTHPKERQ